MAPYGGYAPKLVRLFFCGGKGGRRLAVRIAVFTWEFPKITGTLLGVPIIRTIVFWSLYWGLLILGNYHMVQGSLFCGRGMPILP